MNFLRLLIKFEAYMLIKSGSMSLALHRNFLRSRTRFSAIPYVVVETVILCLLLMLAGKSAWAQTQIIANGGFEIVGGGWVVQTNGVNQTDSWWNINLPSGAHLGSRYEYIGAQIDAVTAANNVNGLLVTIQRLIPVV